MRDAGNDGLEDRRPAIHNNNNNSSLRKEGGSQRRAGAARGEEPAGGGLHARSAAHGTRAASRHGAHANWPIHHKSQENGGTARIKRPPCRHALPDGRGLCQNSDG